MIDKIAIAKIGLQSMVLLIEGSFENWFGENKLGYNEHLKD